MAEDDTPRKKKVVLTDRQKREMFERWDTGRYTQLELANWYGCGETQIWSLIQRREELGPLEESPEIYDALEIKNIEDVLETLMIRIGKLAQKPSLSEGDRLQLNTLRTTVKTVLDVRKQLKELPKDLHTKSVPMNIETALKLAELIPPEHRERYMQLMRDLAQPQGEPESDLGRRKRPPVLKRPSPGPTETNDSSSPGEIDEASEESEDDELPDIPLVKPKETKTPGVEQSNG